MPRWELASILIASNLLKFVLDAVPQLKDKDIFLWNDSKAALSWCSQVDIKDTLVLNRVKAIRERCPTTIIKYVPTTDNPADILTRDITAEELLKSNLWWQGPFWLTDIQSSQRQTRCITCTHLLSYSRTTLFSQMWTIH